MQKTKIFIDSNKKSNKKFLKVIYFISSSKLNLYCRKENVKHIVYRMIVIDFETNKQKKAQKL